MRVLLSRKAQRDLAELDVKVRGEDPITADWLLDRLLSGIEMLAEHPGLGAAARDPRLKRAGVRALTREGFVIFYRPVAGTLRVMRVLRGRRHWRNVR